MLSPFQTKNLEPCEHITEKKEYIWNKTDLPKRATKAGTDIAKSFKLRTPPKESLFLDRKLGGTFIFLSVIGFKAYTDEWIREYFLTH